MKFVKKIPGYEIKLRYLSENYHEDKAKNQIDPSAIMITITPDTPNLYNMNVTLKTNLTKGCIYLTDPDIAMGIIHESEIDKTIRNLQTAQNAIQEVKSMLNKHFPGVKYN